MRDRLAVGLVLVLAIAAALVLPRAAAADQLGCLRTATIPAPPPGGAVFARPLDPNGSGPNVVVIGSDGVWAGNCATDVMNHPASIAVAPDAAVLLEDDGAGGVRRYSAWGAVDVTADDPAPAVAPGILGWTTTVATTMDPQLLLREFHSCRGCALQGTAFTVRPIEPGAEAFAADLSGADLSGSTLAGDLRGWNLDDTDLSGAKLGAANLSGATFDGARVDGTSFDGANLEGAHFAALRYTHPPSFDQVQIGLYNRRCTTFQAVDLVHAWFSATANTGCADRPLLPGSAVAIRLIAQIDRADVTRVDLADAEFVTDADPGTDLVGADLSGVKLNGSSFVGLPADLVGVNFDGASLADTDFARADLAGATFHDADLAGASFQAARLEAADHHQAAGFGGGETNLEDADLADADVSGDNFTGADLDGAAFSDALAVDTDFSGVRAIDAKFDGAHVYGDGQAFNGATDLNGIDFDNAVLAGDVTLGGGFDLTDADLKGAKFDGTQCIGCNFSGATLSGVSFSGAYLPGVVLSGALTLDGAGLYDAWLYCGNAANGGCQSLPGSPQRWSWPLALGSEESSGSVPFAAANLTGVSLDGVVTCPDHTSGKSGCAGHLLPPADDPKVPPIPAPCSAAGLDACPTPTSTLFDPGATAAPLALTAVVPPTWTTTLAGQGYYVALDDGTIERVGDGGARVIAGRAGRHCPAATDLCGDGGAATDALLGRPTGIAVGIDGSLYVADPSLHRVRRIRFADAPTACATGTRARCPARSRAESSAAADAEIATVAGTGAACDPGAGNDCGDGGPAAKAKLAGPYGVWADPGGTVFIADGRAGVRELRPDGEITTIAGTAGRYDIRAVAGDGRGHLYASSDDPAHLLEITLASGRVTPVVGTGTSGYNGNTNPLTGTLLPGDQVQIDDPGGLSVTADGEVVFADTGNDLIRAYVPSPEDAATGHVIDDLAGIVSDGSPKGGYNGDGAYADRTLLDAPRDVAVTAGALFVVADTGNHRLRLFGPVPADEPG